MWVLVCVILFKGCISVVNATSYLFINSQFNTWMHSQLTSGGAKTYAVLQWNKIAKNLYLSRQEWVHMVFWLSPNLFHSPMNRFSSFIDISLVTRWNLLGYKGFYSTLVVLKTSMEMSRAPCKPSQYKVFVY